jgi:hypothetical protein
MTRLTPLAVRHRFEPRRNDLYRVPRSASSVTGSQQPPAISYPSQEFGSRGLTSNCHSTRSTPVTISVTGCSTCSLVFLLSARIRRSPRKRGDLHFHKEVFTSFGIHDKFHRSSSDTTPVSLFSFPIFTHGRQIDMERLTT